MPVHKCAPKKWKIGTGPCMYKSKENAEIAYGAYRAKTHSEDVDDWGIPEDSALERAKEADLITLPDSIPGTNCGNCSFFQEDHCNHPEVNQPVTARMCCIFWDHPDAKRAWIKDQEGGQSELKDF